MNDIVAVLWEGLSGGIKSVFNISLIVFPLMIVIEIARDLNLLEKLANLFKPITNLMGMSKESAFPLAIGLVFGLAYGAGVIIQNVKEGNIDKGSLVLVSIFLVCCHAVFEDTLVFVAVGANGFLLLTLRIVAAFIITYIVSKKVSFKQEV